MAGIAELRLDRGPEAASLTEARVLAAHCRRCPLYRDATQMVFGEGRPGSPLMLVGEQPGDQEDIAGRPFVGPAGALLDRALAAADIPRAEVYITNAVKHFKFAQRGKRRIHKKLDAAEIDACRWWLDLELKFVGPQVIVAMGTTAVRGVLGRSASIASLRGRPMALDDGRRLMATVHPSYLLRMPDRRAAGQEFGRFVGDLAAAWRAAAARE